MTNKEKFLTLVSGETTETIAKNSERIRNRSMLRESQKIALKVLTQLDKLGWTQKDLAQKLAVSPQQVSKIVSGKENLTLETIVKLQELLDIPLLASYHEEKAATEIAVVKPVMYHVKRVLLSPHLRYRRIRYGYFFHQLPKKTP